MAMVLSAVNLNISVKVSRAGKAIITIVLCVESRLKSVLA